MTLAEDVTRLDDLLAVARAQLDLVAPEVREVRPGRDAVGNDDRSLAVGRLAVREPVTGARHLEGVQAAWAERGLRTVRATGSQLAMEDGGVQAAAGFGAPADDGRYHVWVELRTGEHPVLDGP